MFKIIKTIKDKLFTRWKADGGYRQVLILALPLILSTGSNSIQSFINRIFLAWDSPVSLAASMPAGIINFALMSIFINTAGYVSTFVAQYYGAKQFEKTGPILWQAGIIAVIGTIINLALIPVAPYVFNWVGHDPAVVKSEIILFQVLCLTAFPSIMSSAMAGMMSGLGKTHIVMLVMLLATGVNVIADYILIFGRFGFPHLGIAGAGCASILSFMVQLIIYTCIIFSPSFRKTYKTAKIRPDRKLLARLVKFGLPSGIQFFIDMAGFSAFILLVGKLGLDQLAASNLTFNINTLAFMPMIGIGITVSVLVGQALGKNEPHIAKYSVVSAFHVTFIYMAIIAFLFIAIPDIFIAPFQAQSDPESFVNIKRIALILIRFVAIYTLFDAVNIIFSSAIKGAGDTRFVMYMILALSICLFVSPVFIAIVVFKASLYVCWTIASIYIAVMACAFFLRYRSGKWMKMRVIEEVHSPGGQV